MSNANTNQYGFNCLYRDAVQSNLETNPSAQEMVEAIGSVYADAYESFQITGGTFMDLFIRKGRDAWGENDVLFKAFEDVITSALVRGDCGLGYERNPQDVLDALIEELAARGLNVVTNFHGMNYAPMQEGIFKAVQKARANGYDIVAPKVICIEDNPNHTVESCMAALEQQDAMDADSGIYLKNASGKVDPEFVYDLTKAIAEKYPDQAITFHTHVNHGLADATCLAAALAGAEANAKVIFEVVDDPLSSGTGQPGRSRIQDLLENAPWEAVRARVPEYEREAAETNFDKMYELRHHHREKEVRYSKKLFDAAYKAGSAGGAMSAIKGMGIPAQIQNLYYLHDEDDAFALVLETAAEIKKRFGYPTNVTPYQKTIDQQAGAELVGQKFNRPPYARLIPETINYLIGGLGPVPDLVDEEYKQWALKLSDLKEPMLFVPANQLPPKMDETRKVLEEKGYSGLPQHDRLTAAMFGQRGFDHIIAKQEGTLKPQQPPAKPEHWDENLSGKSGRRYKVAQAIGGIAQIEKFTLNVVEVEKHIDGFYKSEIGEGGWYQKDKAPQAGLSELGKFKGYLKEFHSEQERAAKLQVEAFVSNIPAKLTSTNMSKEQTAFSIEFIAKPMLTEIVDQRAKNASRRSFKSVYFDRLVGKDNFVSSELHNDPYEKNLDTQAAL